MRQVADAKAIAAANGRSYVVRVVTCDPRRERRLRLRHGHAGVPARRHRRLGSRRSRATRTGSSSGSATSRPASRPMTGQTQPVPLLISQFSGWNDIATSAVSQLQYQAHVREQGQGRASSPRATRSTGQATVATTRPTASAGSASTSARPTRAPSSRDDAGSRYAPSRSLMPAASITAKFVVPVPPLVLDTQRVVDPGSYGFEVVDAAGRASPSRASRWPVPTP